MQNFFNFLRSPLLFQPKGCWMQEVLLFIIRLTLSN